MAYKPPRKQEWLDLNRKLAELARANRVLAEKLDHFERRTAGIGLFLQSLLPENAIRAAAEYMRRGDGMLDPEQRGLHPFKRWDFRPMPEDLLSRLADSWVKEHDDE